MSRSSKILFAGLSLSSGMALAQGPSPELPSPTIIPKSLDSTVKAPPADLQPLAVKPAESNFRWKDRSEGFFWFSRGNSDFTLLTLKTSNEFVWDRWHFEPKFSYSHKFGKSNGERYLSELKGYVSGKVLNMFSDKVGIYYGATGAADGVKDVYRTYTQDVGLRFIGTWNSTYLISELGYRYETYAVHSGFVKDPEHYLSFYSELGLPISDRINTRTWILYTPRLKDVVSSYLSAEPGVELFLSKEVYVRGAVTLAYHGRKDWAEDQLLNTYGSVSLGISFH